MPDREVHARMHWIAALLVLPILGYLNSQLILSGGTLAGRYGLLSTRTLMLAMSAVRAVRVEFGPLGRKLGFGTVVLESFSGETRLPFLADAQVFGDELESMRVATQATGSVRRPTPRDIAVVKAAPLPTAEAPAPLASSFSAPGPVRPQERNHSAPLRSSAPTPAPVAPTAELPAVSARYPAFPEDEAAAPAPVAQRSDPPQSGARESALQATTHDPKEIVTGPTMGISAAEFEARLRAANRNR